MTHVMEVHFADAVGFAIAMDDVERYLKEKIAKLKAIREAIGWSQEHCAHELGVTFSSLHRWEHGEVLPRSEAIVRAIDEFIAKHESTLH